MKKPWNLRVFPISNVWWVDIHSTLTICLFYTRCLKERQKSECILRGSNQLCTAVLIFINVQLYPILHKTLPQSRIKRVDCRYCYTEAFKTAHARKTCLCFWIAVMQFACVKKTNRIFQEMFIGFSFMIGLRWVEGTLSLTASFSGDQETPRI